MKRRCEAQLLRSVLVAVIGLLGYAAMLDAQDWSSWRGPADDGMARGDAPVTWSGSDGVAWEVDLPGRGHSSPVVWGNQIFITTAVPIGSENEIAAVTPGRHRPRRAGGGGGHPGGPPFGRPGSGHPGGGPGSRHGTRSPHGDLGPQVHHRFLILSLDQATGNVLWQRTATEATPHEGFHPQYGSFASHSPVTDGEHVIAYFGSRGLYCFDLDGALIWRTDLGEFSKFLQFGEGTPPVLHDDRVIIKADHEGESFLVALNKATGEELWRATRDEGTSWSSPLVVDYDGHRQVVVAATGMVRSYDFESGDVIWEVAGLGRNQIPAPVHQDDLVLVMSGFISPNLMAIRLGERGNLTESDAVVWTHRQSLSYTASPVLHENQLYVLTDNGILTNFNATTGEIHYRERLPGPSNFKASPVGAGGKLYLASEEGHVFAVKMGPTFELLATNVLEDASFIATPAIVDGTMLLRSRTGLYKIGDTRDTKLDRDVALKVLP